MTDYTYQDAVAQRSKEVERQNVVLHLSRNLGNTTGKEEWKPSYRKAIRTK